LKTLKLLIILVSLVAFLSCHKYNDEDIKNIDVDQYIELLKTSKYDSMHLPAFTYQDIPALLKYRNETQIITDFPRNGISSYYQRDCRLGMYVLWTVESIRAVAVKSKYLIGRFPSQNPILQKKDDWTIFEYSSEAHRLAARAYYYWWEGNKHKGFEEFKTIDPLSKTIYRWH
jgi:hypothetical protein